MSQYRCERCSHLWEGRLWESDPIRCPHCQSKLWRTRKFTAPSTRMKREDFIKKHQGGLRCEICGDSDLDICSYDSHHLDPKKKTASPGVLFHRADPRAEFELKSCRIICASCHRLVTRVSYDYARVFYALRATQRALLDFDLIFPVYKSGLPRLTQTSLSLSSPPPPTPPRPVPVSLPSPSPPPSPQPVVEVAGASEPSATQ